MMLQDLPPEVLNLIVARIYKKDDLKSLSEVSKGLREPALRELYRSITIRAPNERYLACLGLSILEHSAKHLKYVRELKVTAPFHKRLASRCPGRDLLFEPETHQLNNREDTGDDYDDSGPDEEGPHMNHTDPYGFHHYDYGSDDNQPAVYARDHKKFSQHLDDQMSRVFDCLADGMLQGFSWNLGTCVPPHVAEYIRSKQPQITSLTIAPDVSCALADHSTTSFAELRDLRHISWTLHKSLPREKLGTILESNANHLQTIDIRHGIPDGPDDPSTEALAANVTLLGGWTKAVCFPALKSLTLYGANLSNDIESSSAAFGMPQLRHLKIQDCFGTNKVLNSLATSSQTIPLRSLELGLTGHFNDGRDAAPFSKFLLSFQGLEDLFILHPGEWTLGPEYWSAIHHHHATLRKLVHQQASTYGLENNYPFDGLAGILGDLQWLECLGLCYDPENLPTLLGQVKPLPKIKMLHIRPWGWAYFNNRLSDDPDDGIYHNNCDWYWGPEQFAKWAFGPEGLPDLQVVAFGDFSWEYGDYNSETGWPSGRRQPNFLVCPSDRADGKLRPFDAGEFEKDGVAEMNPRCYATAKSNFDFLEACSEDTLFHVR